MNGLYRKQIMIKIADQNRKFLTFAHMKLTKTVQNFLSYGYILIKLAMLGSYESHLSAGMEKNWETKYSGTICITNILKNRPEHSSPAPNPSWNAKFFVISCPISTKLALLERYRCFLRAWWLILVEMYHWKWFAARKLNKKVGLKGLFFYFFLLFDRNEMVCITKPRKTNQDSLSSHLIRTKASLFVHRFRSNLSR